MPPKIVTHYQLSCLLCGLEDTEAAQRHPRHNRLVALQLHAVAEHGVSQPDFSRCTRDVRPGGVIEWMLPDGRAWLRSIEVCEEVRACDS